MNYPNIWGQGAIFSYSGTDGVCSFEKALPCTLLGDFLGIRIHAKKKYDLYVGTEDVKNLSHRIVASDIIISALTYGDSEVFDAVFAFAAENIIVGKCRNGKILLRPVTEDDGRLFLRTAERNGYTYFTVSETENSALSPDEIENVITKKLAFYDGLPKVNIKDANTEKMFYKCVSVMKSQVYTPSGIFSHRWTTPNKVPHRVLWLWDSVFHSLGNYYISPSLARETLFAVLDTQRSDGFVPHMGSPTEISSVTQPPVLAYGFLRLYEKTGDRQMLAEVYPRLSAYLDWNTKNRTDAENGLYVWHVDISSTHCRCDESGMDNSPRFDDVRDMDCIDFSCYMKHEAEIMAKIAEIIGAGDAERWRTLSEKVSHAIKTVLWDENDGFFYDRIIESGKFRKKKSVASFLTLFAGACTKEQAALLVSELENPTTFGTPFPIPSISADDPTFGTDMWRGPVWICCNYLVAEGLRRYGYKEKADELIRKTIEVVTENYIRDGVTYEFYDPMRAQSPSKINRKGPVVMPYDFEIKYQCIRDFGWSATLTAAMILENPELFG